MHDIRLHGGRLMSSTMKAFRAGKLYFGLFAVASLSFWGASLFPTTDALRAIVATPAIGSMFFALWQIFRDEEAHRRQLELQRQQQIYSLSVTSHMASAAFDRHVEFCDKYAKRVREGFIELLQSGPTPQAINIQQDLTKIRLQHSLWLAESIQSVLEKFEKDLATAGRTAQFAQDERYARPLPELGQQQWDKYLQVLGIQPGEAVTVDRVMEGIKGILQISELTDLRQNIIREAAKALSGVGR